jgi:hypothetical protein
VRSLIRNPTLSRDQFIVEPAQPFGEQTRAGQDRHEIRVATPTGHDVEMQVIGHSRAGALPEVQTDIETLRMHRFTQQHLSMRGQIPKLENFIFA